MYSITSPVLVSGFKVDRESGARRLPQTLVMIVTIYLRRAVVFPYHVPVT